ncbi:hypothetical protein C8R44DRAFT_755687 [Mycena epipterygia]|nr:hypothetical protein C8R44DRAFT_755687 [Mycena epipterygia]
MKIARLLCSSPRLPTANSTERSSASPSALHGQDTTTCESLNGWTEPNPKYHCGICRENGHTCIKCSRIGLSPSTKELAPIFKTRRCGLCRENGHNRLKCPQQPSSLPENKTYWLPISSGPGANHGRHPQFVDQELRDKERYNRLNSTAGAATQNFAIPKRHYICATCKKPGHSRRWCSSHERKRSSSTNPAHSRSDYIT